MRTSPVVSGILVTNRKVNNYQKDVCFNHFNFIYLSANGSLLINDKMRVDHHKRV